MHVQINVLWFKPWDWGVTSQIRDYIDLAIVAILTNGRTLLHDPGRKYPYWCKDGDWLMCFFEPFSGNQCNHLLPNGPVIKTENLEKLTHDQNKFLQFENYRRANNLISEHYLFPNAIWDKLVRSNHVMCTSYVAPTMCHT